MAESKRKGKIAEVAIIRAALERGYRVALPLDEDSPYDLVVERIGRDEPLQRVQCKYVQSDGRYIQVRCRATNNWSVVHYTERMIDWIAVHDVTSDCSYFVPARLLGPSGRSVLHLRLAPTRNGQTSNIRWATDFRDW